MAAACLLVGVVRRVSSPSAIALKHVSGIAIKRRGSDTQCAECGGGGDSATVDALVGDEPPPTATVFCVFKHGRRSVGLSLGHTQPMPPDTSLLTPELTFDAQQPAIITACSLHSTPHLSDHFARVRHGRGNRWSTEALSGCTARRAGQFI